MDWSRTVVALAAPIFVLTAAAQVSASQAAISPSNQFTQTVLAEHNRARDEAGVPRLRWSVKLAGDAQGWAQRLAQEGWLRHASHSENRGAGRD